MKNSHTEKPIGAVKSSFELIEPAKVFGEVGGVGQNLLIPGHAGIEYHFTNGFTTAGKGATRK
jgi:hypothetical protein